MLMEPIIVVFIKLMGAAISGRWDLGDTRTSRDYDALVRSLVWQCESSQPTAHKTSHFFLNCSLFHYGFTEWHDLI